MVWLLAHDLELRPANLKRVLEGNASRSETIAVMPERIKARRRLARGCPRTGGGKAGAERGGVARGVTQVVFSADTSVQTGALREAVSDFNAPWKKCGRWTRSGDVAALPAGVTPVAVKFGCPVDASLASCGLDVHVVNKNMDSFRIVHCAVRLGRRESALHRG